MLRPRPARSPLPRRRLRPLLALRRHPRAWWLVTGAAALTAGLLASSVVGRAEAARQAWGETAEVVVATRDLSPGDRLDAGALAIERRPLATVPGSALTELPEGRVAAAAIVEGEVVVAERLAGEGLDGVPALLPPGTRAVAIPADPSLTPPVDVGDRVDLVVALAALPEGSASPPGFTLVADALVVAVTESAVSIAVSRDDTSRVAVALGAGSVTLALAGGAT
ncbi:MAG: SAF domain-containing protein [Actinomycetota bacterium]